LSRNCQCRLAAIVNPRRASASADLVFEWIDDDEVRDSARAALVVAG